MTPGDTLTGDQDYIEGNQGSDNGFGGEGEDDVVGGSSANTGHLNVILPPGDRDLDSRRAPSTQPCPST